jgi:3-oxoadipate enol-lactonase
MMTLSGHAGIRLNVVIDGPDNGEALLLLHSLGCDLSMWDEQAKALAGKFRLIRFDARGHGRSASPPGDYTIDDLGHDALAVLDQAGVDRAHLCGISMGGVTAQWLAITAPTRVRSLTLANTAARIGTVESWQTRRDTVLDRGMNAIADAVIGRFFSEAFRAASPTVVSGFYATLEHTNPQGYAGCCAALRDADLRGDLRRIAAAARVIGGNKDVSTPLADAEALAQGIAGARLSVLDAAHLSNIEQPARFTALLKAQLEAVDG